MPRYINEDDFCEYIRKNTTPSGAEWFISKIKDMPAADVAETKHGKWKTGNENVGMYYCSNCKHEFVLMYGEPKDNSYNFCPNCGADMDTRGDKDA